MKLTLQQPAYYILLLFIAAGLFAVALGPGLWGNTEAGLRSWQHLVFELACHQDPLRSYSVNGEVMAVCSRCIGIYGAFFIGVLGMPVTARYLPVRNKLFLQLMTGVIVLNMLDVAGNLMGIWTNSMVSRLLLGTLFGITVAGYLTSGFFTITKHTEIRNGE